MRGWSVVSVNVDNTTGTLLLRFQTSQTEVITMCRLTGRQNQPPLALSVGGGRCRGGGGGSRRESHGGETQLFSLGIIHIYGKIITQTGLSELQRDEVSPRSVFGRQQARAKLDASQEQGSELRHDLFCLS